MIDCITRPLPFRSMLLAVFLSMFVTACGREEDGVSRSAADASGAPGIETSAQERVEQEVPELTALKTRLLAGQAGHLRYDRIQRHGGNKAGRERQIYIEMTGASAAEAATQSLEALQAQGFTLESRSEGNDEDIRASLGKADRSQVKLRIRSRAVHANLVAENATSSVYVTYDLP